MKSISNSNTLEGKEKEMTFSDYYQNIPSFPKRDFVREVCMRCEVNESTVYNWTANRSRPQKISHYRILSEMTGIPAENLFTD